MFELLKVGSKFNKSTKFIFAVAVSLLLPLSAQAANLLTNPTFDTDVTGWISPPAPSTLQWDGSLGSPTAGSALVTNAINSNGAQATGAFQCVAVVGGLQYTFSGQVRIPQNPRKGKGGLAMMWYPTLSACTAGTGLIASNSVAAVVRNAFAPLSVTAAAPAAATYARAFLSVTKPGGGKTGFQANFDNLSFAGLPGTIQLTAATYSASENAPVATITLQRVGGTNGTVTVQYTTTNGGTAIAGTDYTPVSGTVTFADGVTTGSFDIPLIDDLVLDGDKTVTFAISAPTGGASLGTPTTGTLTIVDNESLSPGALQFSGSSYTVAEGGGSVLITVNRTGGGAGGVTVDYATSDGSATAPADYNATSGTLTFAANELTKTFSVTINQDAIVEPSELFSVSLSNPTGGATLTSPGTASVTITDDDVAPAILQFSAPNYSVGEGGGFATATITRTGGLIGDVTVDWSTSDGTATAGADYTAVTTTITIPQGTSSVDVTIPILEDLLIEGDETVNLTLTNPSPGDPNTGGGAVLGSQTTAVLTIVDNDFPSFGTLQFSSSAYSIGESGGFITINVVRTGGSDGPVSVQYATSNGTATAGSDYTANSGTLNFANGDVSLSFDVAILPDTLVEGDETVNLTLSNPTGGAALGSPSASTLTIVDDDFPPAGSFQFSAASASVAENAGTATITVLRTGGSFGAVSVNYASADGSAIAGQDYTAVSGTLNFADGVTSQSFTVSITDDVLPESNETLSLILSNPVGATISSPSSESLTIVDNDQPLAGAFAFSMSSYTMSESGGVATITVNRTGGSAGLTSVDYATSNGTATAGQDYTANSGTLTFAAGEVTKTFDIAITNDLFSEPDETVNLTLSNPQGGATLGSPSAATLTITNDDGILPFDPNGDGLMNTTDIFYLINFLFSQGPALKGDGDANGNMAVEPADIFYAINFFFAGGPIPQ